MTRLRYVVEDKSNADWDIPFYEGVCKVRNGETETDRTHWIEYLVKHEGFRVVDETPPISTEEQADGQPASEGAGEAVDDAVDTQEAIASRLVEIFDQASSVNDTPEESPKPTRSTSRKSPSKGSTKG